MDHTRHKKSRICQIQRLVLLPCMAIPNLSTPPRKLLTPPLYKMPSHINWTFRVLSVRHGQTMCHSPVRKF